MSLMSYTYASCALGEELTLFITMPEKSREELLPFTAIVLIPPASSEPSHYLRTEPLERYGRGQIPLATVSLPGCVVKHPLSVLKDFLVGELPLLMEQFSLKLSAIYVHDRLTASLMKPEDGLTGLWSGLRMNRADETLAGFLGGLMEERLSSKA